jgi:hypothetical protein
MYDPTTILTDEGIEEIAEKRNYPKLQIEFLISTDMTKGIGARIDNSKSILGELESKCNL